MTVWRKSSFSDGQGQCLELGESGDRVLVRNSNRPDAGTLSLSLAELAAFVAGCSAGEFDDLGNQR